MDTAVLRPPTAHTAAIIESGQVIRVQLEEVDSVDGRVASVANTCKRQANIGTEPGRSSAWSSSTFTTSTCRETVAAGTKELMCRMGHGSPAAARRYQRLSPAPSLRAGDGNRTRLTSLEGASGRLTGVLRRVVGGGSRSSQRSVCCTRIARRARVPCRRLCSSCCAAWKGGDLIASPLP